MSKLIEIKFDEKSRYFSPDPGINRIFVQSVLNYLSHRFKARGYLFLNEAFEELGLPRTSEGQLIGWIDPEKEKRTWWEFEASTENDDIVLKFFTDGVMYDKIEG